ncbi:MAG: sulfite exporter TauE/SafE family protein [Brachymonas sp.]|nr:sulfite exporter TauE/SafE family protein [Brachymonas sp.]
MTDLAFVLSGFFVGFVVGLTGVGGGSLMTPILIFGFGIKPILAVGTDLLFAAFTKLGGTVNLTLARRIDWKIVGALSIGSIPAALLTVGALHYLGAAQDNVQKVMTTTLGFALLLTAAATLYKAIKGSSAPKARELTPEQLAQATKPRHPALPIIFGALIGVLVSLTSVGAGAIGVTALMLLYPALPLNRIVAADVAYAVPLTLVAGLGHASIGSVDWPLLAKLLAGSLPGIWIGTQLGHKVPDRAIRSILSLLLAYAGIKLLAI